MRSSKFRSVLKKAECHNSVSEIEKESGAAICRGAVGPAASCGTRDSGKSTASPTIAEPAGSQELREGGLEPPYLAVPDPKSGASANFATLAWIPIIAPPQQSGSVPQAVRAGSCAQPLTGLVTDGIARLSPPLRGNMMASLRSWWYGHFVLTVARRRGLTLAVLP